MMEPDQQVFGDEKTAAVLLQLSMHTTSKPSTTPQALDAARCVDVSKQDVFERGLQVLSLHLHEAKALVVGNDQMIAFVCIDVPPHGQHPILHQRKFFGDYKLTEDDALESAKLAALIYLQERGILLVHDINMTELNKCKAELEECQRRLLAASSWALEFQEHAENLKTELDAARGETKKLAEAAKATNPDQFNLRPDVLPLQTGSILQYMSTTSVSYPATSSSNRKKKRTFRGCRVRRTLFKK